MPAVFRLKPGGAAGDDRAPPSRPAAARPGAGGGARGRRARPRDPLRRFELWRCRRRVRFRYRLDGYDDDWLDAGFPASRQLQPICRRALTLSGSRPPTTTGAWSDEGGVAWRARQAASVADLVGLDLVCTGAGGPDPGFAAPATAEGRARTGDRRAGNAPPATGLREANRLKDGFLAERERLIAELEAKNSELARFNYTVAHDLKNPLVTILNYLGVARRDAAAGRIERLARDLDQLEAAAGQLQRQLEELFELSRVGVQANPAEEVAFGRAGARRGGRARGLDRRGRSGGRGGRWAAARARRSGSPAGGGASPAGETPSPTAALRPRCGSRWGLRSEGAERVLFVRDNGPRYRAPVPREDLPALRAPRSGRVGRDRDRAGAGSNASSRSTAGRIWVESEGRGRGATFYFTLPGVPQ